jgi:predicted ATPase
VIATHAPILMAYPEASIFVCTAEGIRQRAYEDTERYEVMHEFMANPRRMLKQLLETPKVP